MPPAGPLSDEQIAIIKQWIDEGAEWPDAASGETPAPPADPDATRLMALIRDDDRRGDRRAAARQPTRRAVARAATGRRR